MAYRLWPLLSDDDNLGALFYRHFFHFFLLMHESVLMLVVQGGIENDLLWAFLVRALVETSGVYGRQYYGGGLRRGRCDRH